MSAWLWDRIEEKVPAHVPYEDMVVERGPQGWGVSYYDHQTGKVMDVALGSEVAA